MQVYLEVEVQDVHLMHVLQPFTDLAYKQHRVQLRQVVVLINDAVKQLASLNTEAHTHIYQHLEKELLMLLLL